MDKMLSRTRPNPQKKYRKVKADNGYSRFELQVKAETKARFEGMVEIAAEEYVQPWSLRQRMAKARERIFDEITQGTIHEFITLKDQIESLQNEVRVLSPSFFKSDVTDATPLPEAIRALPDDPKKLKALLARTYQEAQTAKSAAHRYKNLFEQHEKLYAASSLHNDELVKKIKGFESNNDDY